MPNPQSELRIFISSTFHDLQEEREYLIKKVFPEIRHLCRERGVEFTEIDLRWGLTEEEATHGKIIRTCLEEIDRCRPYFIGIIGERYGWSPKFHEVQKDAELIRKYPWIEDSSADGASIIDMEFQYGVLQNPSNAFGAYFYFRKNAEASTDPNAKRLESLKKRTRASKRPVKEFTASKELGEFVRQDLTRLIELHWHKETELPPLEIERASHEAFASTRRRAYILNPQYLKVFNEFTSTESHDSPLVISGMSGIGKSSLMAYLAHSYQRRFPSAFIVSHYIGASASTSDHSGLLRHICLEIKDRLNLEEEVPSTTEELTREFSNWLAKVQDEKLTIFIDALNQLEGNSVNLGWLPAYIPPNIAVICSTTEGASLNALHERKAVEIELKPLSDEERESIIVRFLGEYHKGLSGAQSKRIANDPKSAIPLFLRTLLEELRLVGNFEEIDSHIEYYLASDDLDDLFKRVLERMEKDYGEPMLEEFMTLLWSSRRGLSESELLDLLAVSSVAPDNQPVTRLDLSLLLNALDYHLIRKDGLLSFFHDYLRNAVEKRYLGDKDKQKALHSKLAKYFATLPVGKRRIDEEPWQWQNAEDWENFNGSLTNIPLLEKLLDEDRLYELIGYWVKLHDHFDPASHYRTAIERFEKECDDENRLATLYGKLGNAFTVSAAYDAAEHFLRLALELRRKHPHEKLPIAEILHKLGILHYERRENNKAEICFREALTLLADEKDSESRDFSLMVEKDLGAVMIALRKYDEAELIYTKVLDQVQRKSKS
ncbi:MAG: DUF4062 domain-containing protein [Bacteroidota bacterium]|nr:DUF4062 domain-containing protein [Bacteroidota bacterium]